MKYNTKAIALIAFLTILSSYVVQVNCNEYDDLFLIQYEDLLSEDNQYLEDESFFDLSQKLNQIRREKHFLEESEEEFDLYESTPDEMDELEWKWWRDRKKKEAQEKNSAATINGDQTLSEEEMEDLEWQWWWDRKKKEAKEKKSADTTTQGDQTLSEEFFADVVEEALEETAEKLEYEQGNLQDTQLPSGVYTFRSQYDWGLHIDGRGVKMRKLYDLAKIPNECKLNIQQCGNGFFSISRSWNEGGISRVMYVNPSSMPLSMDETQHCNFKIQSDLWLVVSDGRYVVPYGYHQNFFGINDDATDSGLTYDIQIADYFIIRKW